MVPLTSSFDDGALGSGNWNDPDSDEEFENNLKSLDMVFAHFCQNQPSHEIEQILFSSVCRLCLGRGCRFG